MSAPTVTNYRVSSPKDTPEGEAEVMNLNVDVNTLEEALQWARAGLETGLKKIVIEVR